MLATRGSDYVEGLTRTRYIGGHEASEAVDGLNEWVAFFAAACRRAVSDAEAYETEVAQLQQTWRARLRKVRSGSAMDLLLDVLPGAPIVTVQSAAALIDRSVQAVNQAGPRLTDAGILSQTTVGKRNRAFEAPELIDTFTALERRLASPEGDMRTSRPADLCRIDIDDDRRRTSGVSWSERTWPKRGRRLHLPRRHRLRRRSDVDPPALAGLARWLAVWRMLDWRSEPCSATRVGPAIRSRPWGAMLRIGGLALCTAERPRSGTSLLVAGCSPQRQPHRPYRRRNHPARTVAGAWSGRCRYTSGVSDALLGLVAGFAAGAVMTRWGLCFNRAVRHAAFERRPRLLRAFAIAVAAQFLLLPLLIAAGVGNLEHSADAGGPALLPVAQLVGGLGFGAGMALAGGCVTGMLWKAGAGAVALGIAIAGFAVGELLIRGPGSGVIDTLDDASRPGEHALTGLLGVGYTPLALLLGAGAFGVLLARHRTGLIPGLALGCVAAVAWVAADAAGYDYGLGFVGAAEGTRATIETGRALPFQLWLAVGVIAGGAALGARRARMPDPARTRRAATGGLLMGVGGNIAHGCNIGHGLTGLPLLSLGSLLATLSMAAGALLTWRLLLATRPALRGRESMLTT